MSDNSSEYYIGVWNQDTSRNGWSWALTDGSKVKHHLEWLPETDTTVDKACLTVTQVDGELYQKAVPISETKPCICEAYGHIPGMTSSQTFVQSNHSKGVFI